MVTCRVIAVAVVAFLQLAAGQDTDVKEHIPGIRFSREVLAEPRPLNICRLRIDLTDERVRLAAVVTPDPDGDGPAEAVLQEPLILAEEAQLAVAINTNAFRVLSDDPTVQAVKYLIGVHADILGLAVDSGEIRSQAQANYFSLWQGQDGRLHLGHPPESATIIQGAAGFGSILEKGRLLGSDGPRHPRTAVGLDRDGTTLWLVVVDGRQQGFSEGMTTAELAAYMLALGCHDAANLDGGGSSIMLMTDPEGKLRVMNRPSTRIAGISLNRPIPMLFGVRRLLQ